MVCEALGFFIFCRIDFSAGAHLLGILGSIKSSYVWPETCPHCSFLVFRTCPGDLLFYYQLRDVLCCLVRLVHPPAFRGDFISLLTSNYIFCILGRVIVGEVFVPKYILPFPKSFPIDIRPAPFHKTNPSMAHCIDFALPIGTPVLAARSGVVIEARGRFTKAYSNPQYAHRCNRVIISHDDGEQTIYVHLLWRSVCVRIGERVKRGEQIALSGQTGYATYPHLHFGVCDEYGQSMKVQFS